METSQPCERKATLGQRAVFLTKSYKGFVYSTDHILGASEVSANLYCNSRIHLYWEGCVIFAVTYGAHGIYFIIPAKLNKLNLLENG